MVCEDMVRTGVLGHPNEYFAPFRPDAGKDWQAELAALRERGATPNGVTGAKLMANQLASVERCLATFCEPGAGTHPHVLSAFRDAKWVWVRRRDTLGQAISLFLAEQSGIYHVAAGESELKRGASVHLSNFDERTAGDVTYNYEAILQRWNWFRTQDFRWDRFFALNQLEPLVIYYEDAAQETVAGQIAEFAGVPLTNLGGPRAYVKLPSARNDVVRERFLADLFARA